MTTLNRPDRVTLDAYNDASLEFGGPYYSSFTNRLTTPILNAKGIQLLNINYVNSTLQLNDTSQLMFFYYTSATSTGIVTLANLRCIRLHPSTFVPNASPAFTAFVKNKYFTSVPELITALNAAASTGGDDATYNPRWVAGQVTFYYDTLTRKISINGNGTNYIAPAAADDPNVIALLASATLQPRMNTLLSSNTYATATIQPSFPNVSMNARLGFCLGYNTRGLFWGGSSQQGVATSTGVPTGSSPLLEADAWPILLGAQNLQVYCSVVAGSGMDSLNRKNLAASIPIEHAPLNVASYTMNSINAPLLSVPSEIYEIGIQLTDEYGCPFLTPMNYNVELSFMVLY